MVDRVIGRLNGRPCLHDLGVWCFGKVVGWSLCFTRFDLCARWCGGRWVGGVVARFDGQSSGSHSCVKCNVGRVCDSLLVRQYCKVVGQMVD